jgi:hypothetical protein
MRLTFPRRNLNTGAFSGIDIVLVVFDLGSRESFDHAAMWLELLAFVGTHRDKTVVLIANKVTPVLSECCPGSV